MQSTKEKWMSKGKWEMTKREKANEQINFLILWVVNWKIDDIVLLCLLFILASLGELTNQKRRLLNWANCKNRSVDKLTNGKKMKSNWNVVTPNRINNVWNDSDDLPNWNVFILFNSKRNKWNRSEFIDSFNKTAQILDNSKVQRRKNCLQNTKKKKQ